MRMRFMLPAVLAAASIAVTLPAVSAGAASASGAAYSSTLAGPSEAPMYSSGLTWDSSGPLAGRLVVADTGYNRVSVFNPSSCQSNGNVCTPQLQFGSLGSNPGQFSTPRDVAVDASSNIYVADANNSRVEAFNSSGQFLWQTGMLGTCASCLNVPIGISYDPTTNEILVADTGHSLIKAYAAVGGAYGFSAGQFIWKSPSGIMKSPREARRGPDGEIWVADYHDEEIRAFQCTCTSSSTGWNTTWNKQLGDGAPKGHGNGELNSPYNVVFSADGNTAYVADTGNERIAVFNVNGCSGQCSWLANYGQRAKNADCTGASGSMPNGNFTALRRVTIDPSTGNLWAADFWGSGIHEFSSSGAVLSEIDGIPAPAPGFAEAYGIAVGPDGNAYAVDRLNQRIEWFAPPANGPSTYQNCEGKRGTAVGDYSWPETIAVAPDKTVWVGDTRNGRLEQFPAAISPSTKPLSVYGSTGSGNGQFNYIEGITVASNGVVWVADTKNNRIDSYNPSTGNFQSYGTRGSGTSSCQFVNPQGVAVNSGNIYVADTGNNRIVEVTVSGGACSVAATYTGLDAPQGVTVAPNNGTVWVANTGFSSSDANGNDIVQLSADLSTNMYSFGGPGTGNSQFDLPHSLAFSPDGSTLFVADTYNNRVTEFAVS